MCLIGLALVERGVGEGMHTSRERRHGLAVAAPPPVAARQIAADQVERVVSLRTRLATFQPVGDERAARRRTGAPSRRVAHIGQHADAAMLRQRHPGAARRQVAPAEQPGRACRRAPPIERRGRPVEELVAVGGDDEREARVRVEPWPKVRRLSTALEHALRGDEADLVARLFSLLGERSVAADADLPETGIGLERERMLSPIFITTPDGRYGTRCSTVILGERGDAGWQLKIIERTHDRNGKATHDRHVTLTHWPQPGHRPPVN